MITGYIVGFETLSGALSSSLREGIGTRLTEVYTSSQISRLYVIFYLFVYSDILIKRVEKLNNVPMYFLIPHTIIPYILFDVLSGLHQSRSHY